MAIKTDKTQRKDQKPELKRGFKTPEFATVLLALLSLIVLLNPFSGAVLAVAPALLFLAAFALFIVPGLVLALALLPGPDLAGLARVPVAFVLSVGVFGFAALPSLVLTKSLAFYPIICGTILALSLGLAVFRIARQRVPAEDEEGSAIERSTMLLWVPFLLLTGVLARISAASVPKAGDDVWIYLSYIRSFLESGRLSTSGASSRLAVNGWLPEQSVLSSISGLDPVDLVLRYLAPALVVVALLALYALARTLLKNEKAALVIGSLAALFFLVALGSLSFHSVLAPAGEFVDHITEDKFIARYAFLPVALSLAILFVRDQSWRNLGLFFFVCLSVALVHPLGLVFIGISLAGFGLIHLAINRRYRGAWRGVGGLWLTLLVITGPPALYLMATGSPLLSKLDSTDPGTAANLIGTWQYQQRLLQFSDGSYIMHPSLLLDPAMLAAYALGIPFLIWKIKQAKDGLAAQLLLGALAFVPILTFVPYTATPISDVIGPWLLYRLTWPLLLMALLALGWMCWEALRLVGSGLDAFGSVRRVAPFLPLILIVGLLADAVPATLTALRAADDPAKIAQADSSCLDPTFRWIQATITTSSRMMAPRAENSCMKAYVPSVGVLGVRGQISDRAQGELESFYNAPTLGPDTLQILKSHKIRYVMLPTSSPLNAQLEHLPGFTRMNNPGERYRMYEVSGGGAFEQSPTIEANGDFNDGEWDAAIDAYTKALDDDPANRFLAYLGLGHAYAEKGLYADAVENYEAALALDPQSPAIHDLLASAHGAAGENDQAQTEFEQAIELDPDNVDLRLRYSQFLLPVDQQKAVDQSQAIVQMYPRVPDYRVKLGTAMMLAGDPKDADDQFERAVYLSPRSASLRGDIGNANLSTGHPERALGYYEAALKLDPNSQLYALNLGKAHAQLSTLNGGYDEGQFEEAKALFGRVEELGHLPWEPDQQETAQIALGDLYLAWDQPENATSAYEKALELSPDSEEAKKKLDGLQSGEASGTPDERMTPTIPGVSTPGSADTGEPAP
jgi:tetratricopeptide (TPR) repeat protein